MVRDAKIRRRDALAIPGWLLVVYALGAIVYAERFRAQSDFCADGSLVLINGLCYTVWKLLAPVLLIGLGLVAGAAFGFKGQPERLEQRLHHGSPSHVLLALLISFVAVPFLFLMVQMYRESVHDITYQITLYGVAYKHVFLLALATLIAALILLPYLIAIGADVRRRKDFLAAAASPQPEPPAEVMELYDDAEGPFPGEEGYRAPDESFESEDEAWPASRQDDDAADEDEPIEVYEPEIPAEHAAWDPESEADAPYYGYRVDRVDVEDVEGIGPAYAKRLHEAGVQTTARLLAEDPEDLAKRTAIAPAHIHNWQKMAELMAVKGIGPQYAEAMVRAGIAGVSELKRRSAATMAKQVNDYLDSLDSNVLGQHITANRIQGWQEAAKAMRKVRMDRPDA